jgi:hypothetical protein
VIGRYLMCAMATAALGGCAALGGPGSSTTQSKLAQAQASHEYRSGPPPSESAAGGAAAPAQAIEAFAGAYVNWTADTVAGDMRTLASQSIGQARSAMQLAAAETANDYELQRGGVSNSGTVEAVAPLLGHRDRYVVVTRELTSATATDAYQGLRPAWHITVVTVSEQVSEQGRGVWVVSGWQPES